MNRAARSATLDFTAFRRGTEYETGAAFRPAHAANRAATAEDHSTKLAVNEGTLPTDDPAPYL
jgi:hypothetical protein